MDEPLISQAQDEEEEFEHLLETSDPMPLITASASSAFDSPTRTVSIMHATLALFSTMIGGGMLTLPFATSKVGIVGSLVLSLVCALLAEYTYYQLILASRQTDSRTFHEIALKTLGKRGHVTSMLCMIGITLMAAMSYLLLIGSLIGEIAYDQPSKAQRNFISGAFVLFLLFPLSLNNNLATLKYSNLFGALASLLLLFALSYELAVEPLQNRSEVTVKSYPETWSDIVFALPFFLTAYTAHFSIIAMDRELSKPTLQRARTVTRGSILLAFILYSSLSVTGYLYALDLTCDSILSNIPPRRIVSIVGRLGLTGTLSLSYPLFVLPNRATICELMQWGDAQNMTFRTRFALTLAFCSCSFGLCCIIPSVAVAFSLTGSTLGIAIGILFPSAFTLGNAKSSFEKRAVAMLIFVFGVVMMVVCCASTYNHRNDASPCD